MSTPISPAITLYIFHETGNKERYRALTDREKTVGDIKLIFREFSIVRFFIKGVVRLDIDLIRKQFINLFFLVRLIFLRDKNIIIGIAPYDFRLLIYYPMLKKNNYFYHTSKTTWGYKNYSKRFLATTNLSKNIWTKFINNATGIFCVTSKVEAELLQYYTPKKTVVVNHAIKKEYSHSITLKNNVKLTCLFVGRIEESKGIRIIFNLIEKLPPDLFTFKFVGKGSLEQEVQNLVLIKSNCEFLGFKEDPELRELYENADVLLTPSIKTGPWEELFGMVVIEAMSRGTVPITTNHTGPREIVTDNINGFLFTEDKYETEATRLLLKLESNRDYLNQLQKNAFEEGQCYSVEAIYQKWNNLLKS